MSIKDGANYAPESKLERVVAPGEFKFAAAFLDHGHINGQTNGLLSTGAELAWVFDPDPEKVAAFVERYPGTNVARSFDENLTSIHGVYRDRLAAAFLIGM